MHVGIKQIWTFETLTFSHAHTSYVKPFDGADIFFMFERCIFQMVPFVYYYYLSVKEILLYLVNFKLKFLESSENKWSEVCNKEDSP